MNKKNLKKWAAATAIRAIKTFAESLASVIGVGLVALNEVNWTYALSVSAVAAILCVLTCIKGLPEVEEVE